MSSRINETSRPGVWFDNNAQHKLLKAGLSGTALALGSAYLYGTATVDVAGIAVPSIVPMFVAGAGASLITDYAHDWYYPYLSNSFEQTLGDAGASVFGAGVAAASSVGIMYLTVGLRDDMWLQAAAVGGASYVAAEFVANKIKW